MRKATLLAVFSFITLSGTNLLADDVKQKIDFENGAGVETAIKNFRRFLPISKTTFRIPKQASDLTEASAGRKGRVIGVDLNGRIRDSAPYNEALKYPPLIEDLPPTVRDPLKADWAALNATRNELIGDANSLENEDAQLYQEGLEIDRNADALDRRRAQLEAEVDQFNRSCTGRPLPPDEYNRCLAWRNDLTGRINQYNADVDAHNNRFDAWRTKALDLKRRAGTASKQRKAPPTPANPFLVQVRSWELSKVNPFINRAKEALESKCGRLVGVSLNPPTAPFVPVKGRARFDAMAQFGPPESKPCPVVYLWRTENTTGHIGRLEVSADQTSATLVTGDDEAKGLVIVEVDEAVGKGKGKQRFSAAAPVTVIKGAVQCRIALHSCSPGGPPFENLCTYDCCGDLEGPATYFSPVCDQRVCGTRFCVPKR